MKLKAPFPYFGGKSAVGQMVWRAFGRPKQYIEPFCGSCAVLLAAPEPCSLEVVNDGSGFIANFWRCVVHQPQEVARWADYPVSHIDLGARHHWLVENRARLTALQDPEWHGDAQIAGWWLWGQCCWIGSGWCDWWAAPTDDEPATEITGRGQIPHISNAGRAVQAAGKIPHISDAGRGVQAAGKIPHISDAGDLHTSSGRAALAMLARLRDRMDRVRVLHGDWDRCLNHHYGGNDTAVFLDPPYNETESLYGKGTSVYQQVAEWAFAHPHLKVALCGHRGDYDAPDGWRVVEWSRKRLTYGGSNTTDEEVMLFSPACHAPDRQPSLFGGL